MSIGNRYEDLGIDVKLNEFSSFDPGYRDMVDFLVDLGTTGITHSGTKGYLAHLVSVYHDLRRWQQPVYLCRAGMYHSIYGTQVFQGFKLGLDQRDELKELIGEEAEWIAFLNCFVQRQRFDEIIVSGSDERVIENRETGDVYEVTDRAFRDLATLHICDWLEQVERSTYWNYRKEALRAMAEFSGDIAVENYDRVFARKPDIVPETPPEWGG